MRERRGEEYEICGGGGEGRRDGGREGESVKEKIGGGREGERERERDKGLTCHRCHESVDRGLLKSLLRMLVDLQVYQEVFEIKFLHETETTYRAEALRMMRDPEFTVSKKKN